MAATAPSTRWTDWVRTTKLPIESHTLGNGLQILVQVATTAPVVSSWVWYRVGLRNEHSGITGISHWVEHMVFKGTERWPAGAADEAIAREGGICNGMTWLDFTSFYETLPADQLALALDIESDRLRGAQITEEGVASERNVILSERQGSEDSPLFQLNEEVSSAAFRIHPYGHETIGYRCDLEAITRDDLADHLATYYTPNNALLTIAGDVDTANAIELAATAFGDIVRGPEPPSVRAVEPRQHGERRVVVEGVGDTDYVKVAYHVPQAHHPDYHALTVLNAILSGGSAFPVGGGHLTNHTSRLYRALVETELTVDIGGHLQPTVDPGLYSISATVWPDAKVGTVTNKIEDELARLREHQVTQPELAKAQRQARALFAYASESISNQAFWLGFSRMFADGAWLAGYLDDLAAVTADDVQRVAQTYLVPSNRTTGWFASRGGGE